MSSRYHTEEKRRLAAERLEIWRKLTNSEQVSQLVKRRGSSKKQVRPPPEASGCQTSSK